MPIPFSDQHYQRSLVENILKDLDSMQTSADPGERARVYEKLGGRYRQLHLYHRAIAMYRKSVETFPHAEVQEELAKLLITLLGESGFAEAKGLVSTHPLHGSQFVVQKAIERKRAAIDRSSQRKSLDHKHPELQKIVGESQHVLDVCEKIITYALTRLSVLITGPTGSGKELVAQAIYACSPRSRCPFVPINCAAIPENLFESTLFGYAKGAFTGADRDQRGYLEEAHPGTLFLDEISKLPLKLQGKLLRVLDGGEFYRLGDPKVRKVDLRVIAATNRNLVQMVEAGEFLEDLYSRLKVVEIDLCPVEERLEDLPLLVEHFIQKHRLESEDRKLSKCDIFYWEQFCYLISMDTKLPRSSRDQGGIAAALEATRQTYQDASAPHEFLGHRLDIRNLENAVQRAVVDLELQPGGNYPFEDALTYQDNVVFGARCYSEKELGDYDLCIVMELVKARVISQKDGGSLLEMTPSTLNRRIKAHGAQLKTTGGITTRGRTDFHCCCNLSAPFHPSV